MKKFERKPQAGKRGSDELVTHWLGEGGLGVECLTAEIDPILYAADAAICREIQRVFRSCDMGPKELPLAVLAPPADSIGWQLGVLARDFASVLWVQEDDELHHQATDHFGAELVCGELPERFEGAVELMLVTEYRWPSLGEFYDVVSQTCCALSTQGQALFVLAGRENGHEVTVQFENGETLSWTEGNWPKRFGMPTPFRVEICGFKELNQDASFGVTEFLQRNRGFFGKEARQLVLQRVREEDFLKTENQVAVLLSFNA